MTPREERDKGRVGPPQSYAEGTPPAAQTDYSIFTVQSVLEMQRTLGGVETSIKHLEDSSKEYGEKLEKIGKDVHAAKIVGGFIALVAGVLGWLIHEFMPLLASLKQH